MRPKSASLTVSRQADPRLAPVEEIEPWRGQVNEHGDRVVVFNVGVLQTLFEAERRAADGWAEVEALDDVQAVSSSPLGSRTPPRSRRAGRRAHLALQVDEAFGIAAVLGHPLHDDGRGRSRRGRVGFTGRERSCIAVSSRAAAAAMLAVEVRQRLPLGDAERLADRVLSWRCR